ncbi:EamA family transporter RarD [Bacillus gobiensis]|uniref:EamA family transporter RarD n=1 Tax=Bacillus gobiensis TaxID=1441095 RepID=UPI003D1E43CB
MVEQKEQTAGVIAGSLAYFIWGVLPIYWKLAGGVDSAEVLANRIVWSFVFMIVLLLCLGKLSGTYKESKSVFSNKKRFLAITAASALITLNWFIFIFVVHSDHVIEASLGYYINPLMNIVLATLFLKERLTKAETVSVVLATIGVIILSIHHGAIPWSSLAMALTFSLYGLIKKVLPIGAWSGLTIETLLITPFALLYLFIVPSRGFMAYDTGTLFVLIGAGIVTAVPLLLFALGAKKISFSLIGFLQYIAPTMMLVLGVFLFHEPFDETQLLAFIWIWVALILFTASRTAAAARLKKEAGAVRQNMGG